MDKHLKFGGLDKETKMLVKPYLASKKNKYMCPHCFNDIVLCIGDIVEPYFRHHRDSVCSSSNGMNKGETREHSTAKYMFKNMFDSGVIIEILKKCECCSYVEHFEIKKKKKYECIIETYKLGGGLHPDLAIVKNDKLKYIIEIFHTHKTESRPGLWFDISANDILNGNKLYCHRPFKCNECYFKSQQKQIMNDFTIIHNNLWYEHSNLLKEIKSQFINGYIKIEQNEDIIKKFYLMENKERLNIEYEFNGLFSNFEKNKRMIEYNEKEQLYIIADCLKKKQTIADESLFCLEKLFGEFISKKKILLNKCKCHKQNNCNNVTLLFNKLLADKILRFASDGIECNLCNKLFIRDFYGSDANSLINKLTDAFT